MPQEEATDRKKACMLCGNEFPGNLELCPDDGTLLTPISREPRVGDVFADRYEILGIIGDGGMGKVYKARHNLMKRVVAIKMLLPHLVQNAAALKRFTQEAQAASALKHPHILYVHDFGISEQGIPYLVMDYLEGVNLSTLLQEQGSLPESRAIPIFIQACSALAHAHSKGVIHRDIKPANIMLIEYEGQQDYLQIVDFGIAKLLQPDGAEQLTHTGEVFGSPLYMSPEQCRGKDLDARSDIYSLGCVLYRAVTGRPVFGGRDAMECMYKQVNDSPPQFSDVCPELGLSESLESAVFKAIAKEPEDRFQTMPQFKEALEAVRGVFPPVHKIFSVPPESPQVVELDAVTDRWTNPHEAAQTQFAGPKAGSAGETAAPVTGAPAANASPSSAHSAASGSNAPVTSESGTQSSASLPGVAGNSGAVATPAASGSSPSVSGSSPSISGSAPSMEGSSPSMSGSSPAMSGPSPAIAGAGTAANSEANIEHTVASSQMPAAEQQIASASEANSDTSLAFDPKGKPSESVKSEDVSLSTSTANHHASESPAPHAVSSPPLSEKTVASEPGLNKNALIAGVVIFAVLILGVAVISMSGKHDDKPLPQGTTGATATSTDTGSASGLTNEATAQVKQGDYQSAEQTLKKAVTEADSDDELLSVLPQQVKVLEEAGKYQAAQDSLNKMLEIQKKKKKSEYDIARTKSRIAIDMLAEGEDPDQAAPLLTEAQTVLSAAPDAEKLGLSEVYYGQSKIALQKRNFPKAVEYLGNAIQRRTKVSGADSPELIQYMQGLAEVYILQGKLAEADETLNNVLSIANKAYGPDSAQAADAYKVQGVIRIKKHKLKEAEPLLTKSLEIKAKDFGADSLAAAEVQSTLAMLYFAEGKFKQAEPLCKQSLDARTRELGADSAQAARSKELYQAIQSRMKGRR